MKTAVETILVGKERQYNRRFQQMCAHYLVDPVACTPASGWEKGQVENRSAGARALLHAPPAREEHRGAEQVAPRSVRRLRQGPSPSREQGDHGLAGVRGGAAEPRALCQRLRRFPRRAGLGVQDVPDPLRQQPLLGDGERRRPPRRSAGLCGADRVAPGRPCRGRACSQVRPQRDRIRALALCAGAGRKPGALRNGAPFKDWCCRPPSSASGASSPAPTMAIARWWAC